MTCGIFTRDLKNITTLRRTDRTISKLDRPQPSSEKSAPPGRLDSMLSKRLYDKPSLALRLYAFRRCGWNQLDSIHLLLTQSTLDFVFLLSHSTLLKARGTPGSISL